MNSSITLSNIPSSTNITPTPYIQFNTGISTFYSTIDSTNSSTASMILQGGLNVNKTISASSLAVNYQMVSPTNGSTVIIGSNMSGVVLSLNTTISNLVLTLPVTSIIDGKLLFITTNQNITNVTINNAVLTSTSMTGSIGLRFMYVLGQNLWFSI